MVRNEGREAENTNDLGHVAGQGLTAHERSAYRGRHYMDCVVKVGGRDCGHAAGAGHDHRRHDATA